MPCCCTSRLAQCHPNFHFSGPFFSSLLLLLLNLPLLSSLPSPSSSLSSLFPSPSLVPNQPHQPKRLLPFVPHGVDPLSCPSRRRLSPIYTPGRLTRFLQLPKLPSPTTSRASLPPSTRTRARPRRRAYCVDANPRRPSLSARTRTKEPEDEE